MSTSTGVLIPLEQYLQTTYRPDRDWIEGYRAFWLTNLTGLKRYLEDT